MLFYIYNTHTCGRAAFGIRQRNSAAESREDFPNVPPIQDCDLMTGVDVLVRHLVVARGPPELLFEALLLLVLDPLVVE